MDRGVFFGDGEDEVLVVYDGRPFRFSHHLARLQCSIDEVCIFSPHGSAQ